MPLYDVDDRQLAGDLPLGNIEGRGEPVDEWAGYEDYFGFDATNRYVLPDGKQWIEFKPMDEGKRARYEAKTSRDVKFNRRTDDAAIRINAAEDRHELILQSVVGWNMFTRNQNGGWAQVPFTIGSKDSSFQKWLLKANPRIVNDLHQAIVRANPWMTSDMTVEMIDEEIKRLEDLKKETIERDAAQKNS